MSRGGPTCSPPEVERAARVLANGGLVAFPTETVYGLGASARDPGALRRIFSVKGRPPDHPLIVHIAASHHLLAWASYIPDAARRLADAFWPGPLTLILPKAPGVADEITGGASTVGVRAPAHPVAQALLRHFGDGIAAPSANRYGRVSPTRASHVAEALGSAVDLILDGGPCEIGLESTIVDLSDGTPRLLRPGAITRAMLEHVLGSSLSHANPHGTPSSGQKPSHYAPEARVVLAAAEQAEATAACLAARGSRVGHLAVAPPRHPGVWWLPLPPTLDQQAASLYQRLHEADALQLDIVVASLPPGHDIAEALADRLIRAAGLGAGRKTGHQSPKRSEQAQRVDRIGSDICRSQDAQRSR